MTAATAIFRSARRARTDRVRETLGAVTATLAEDIAGMRVAAGVHARARGAARTSASERRATARANQQTVVLNGALLPVRRPPLDGRDGGRARLRRLPRLRRRHHDRRPRRVPRLPRRTSSTRCSSSRSSTTRSCPRSPRSTRSWTSSTRSPTFATATARATSAASRGHVAFDDVRFATGAARGAPRDRPRRRRRARRSRSSAIPAPESRRSRS